MAEKEENIGTAGKMSGGTGLEPTEDGNQPRDSRGSQIQQQDLAPESNWQHQFTADTKDELQRLMKEEIRSSGLVDGGRMEVELNQLKTSLGSDNRRRLEDVRTEVEQRLIKTDTRVSKSGQDFGHQLNELRDQLKQLENTVSLLKTALYAVVGLLILLFAMSLSPMIVDLQSRSDHSEQKPLHSEDDGRGFMTSNSAAALEHFRDGAVQLQREFPGQTQRLWRIMEAATLPVLEEDQPTHPAVILLVAGKGDHPVAECLGRRYAALVTESRAAAAAHATFNCETAHSDPDDVKAQLDTTLSRAFDAGSKSSLVLRLEKLPGPAALIFYRFADNDNAPYKDVALVMTLTLESTTPVTGREKDSVAYDELRKVWGSSLDTDKVEPLLSRIGNSVAFVRPETAHILSESGC